MPLVLMVSVLPLASVICCRPSLLIDQHRRRRSAASGDTAGSPSARGCCSRAVRASPGKPSSQTRSDRRRVRAWRSCPAAARKPIVVSRGGKTRLHCGVSVDFKLVELRSSGIVTVTMCGRVACDAVVRQEAGRDSALPAAAHGPLSCRRTLRMSSVQPTPKSPLRLSRLS